MAVKPMPENLTVAEAAEWLRISERTAWALIRDKKIPSFKAGAQRRVNLEALRKAVQEETES